MSDTQNRVCPHCETVNRIPIGKINDQPVCGTCNKPLLTGEALELTGKNFEHYIGQSDCPVLVDFWAPWCGPCRMMSPVVSEAAKALQTSVCVAKVNTEEEPNLAARFGIRSIPTLMIFRNGKMLRQQSGAMNLPSLKHWIDSSLE